MWSIFSSVQYFMQVQAPTASDVGLPEIDATQGSAQALLAVVFGVIAAAAIIVIILSAFNLVTGGGDPDKISRGKKGIIFAVIGLLIAISAEFIIATFMNQI